jgi:predicted O-methyltransferase YrrM
MPEDKQTSGTLKPSMRGDWRSSRGITTDIVDGYLYSLLPARDEVLAEMEAEASAHDIPIVGPAVARLFHQLAMMIGAKTVFEMGSAIGYSTIWWARAVGEAGRVIYTDGDRRNAEKARRYFDRAGVAARIAIQTGDALELLSEQKGQFDIIFNDVDKHDYPRVLKMAAPRLRKGGLFITDNTLWSGKAATPAAPDDKATLGVQGFNRASYASPEFYTVLLPLRDGVTVMMKL